MESTVLRNYAAALYEAAEARGEAEQTVAALELLGGILRTEPEVGRIAAHPGVSEDRKVEFLAKALGEGRTPLIEDFLRLLVQRGRLGELGEIAEAAGRVAAERAGRRVVRVQTCTALSEEQVRRLEGALEQLTGEPVRVKWEVAADLLGGVRIEVEGEVLDETIAGRLQRIEEHLGASPTRAQ